MKHLLLFEDHSDPFARARRLHDLGLSKGALLLEWEPREYFHTEDDLPTRVTVTARDLNGNSIIDSVVIPYTGEGTLSQYIEPGESLKDEAALTRAICRAWAFMGPSYTVHTYGGESKVLDLTGVLAIRRARMDAWADYSLKPSPGAPWRDPETGEPL